MTDAASAADHAADLKYEAAQVAGGLARAVGAAIRLSRALEDSPDMTLQGSGRLLVDDISAAARRLAWIRTRLED